MKKKIVIAAIALASVIAGTVAFESFTGQNEAKAECLMYGTTSDAEGRCLMVNGNYVCDALTSANQSLGTPCRISGGGDSMEP